MTVVEPATPASGLSTLCSFQVYSVQDSPLCLTGTAEVPLAGMYMDQIIPEDRLPIKLAGIGHCFRTEAGAAGWSCPLQPFPQLPMRHASGRLLTGWGLLPVGNA